MELSNQARGVSVREFARTIGVTHPAVRKAIKTGRLRASVEMVHGSPRVVDVELAKREWTENASRPRSSGGRKTARTESAQPSAPITQPGSQVPMPLEPEDPDTESMAEAARREKQWKAALAEQEYRRRAGELVPATEMAAFLAKVEAQMADAFTKVRTKLLGVPRRARSTRPHWTNEDVVGLEDLIREALSELADGATTT